MQLVPLGTLALELGQTVEETATLVGDQIHSDPASGLRMVPAHVCRQLVAAHQQQLAAQAAAHEARAKTERAQQERRDAEHAAANQAREALAQRQREILSASPDLSALELMLAVDADPDDRTPAGRRFDEIIQAERQGHVGVLHRIIPARQE